ncbi:MAG: serine/threonine-protein kinase [Pirellulales bacterium]
MKIEQLGPYKIVRKLGRGGMGTVYEAVNVQTNEPAAVKLLNPHLADEEGFRERFGTEIETLKKLKHPNIVRLFGYGIQDGHPYYAMELVSGTNLEEELQAGRRFDWRETTRAAIRLCRALKHAHDHGVIHRDIKPANLLLTAEGDIKLTDFGIARLFGNTRLTADGGLIGTAEYMPPEQAEGRPVTPHADLYSLGCVMFAMLAGRPPFRSRSLPEMLQMQRLAEPPPVSRYAQDVPVELDRIISRLLAKNGAERAANADLLARQLAAMEHGLSLPKRDVADGGPIQRPESFSSFSSARTVPDQGDSPRLEYDPDAPTRVAENYIAEAPPFAPLKENRRTPTSGVESVSPAQDSEEELSIAVAHREPATLGPDRFVTVEEEEREHERQRRRERGPVVAQIAMLSASLIALIAAAVYFMQPPPADELYSRIQALAADENPDRLLDAAAGVDDFLTRFPQDERAELLRKYQEEIDLLRLERRFARRSRQLTRDPSLLPIERDYIEAIHQIGMDPQRTVEELQALVALYSGADVTEQRVLQVLEVARRQLVRLEKQTRDQAPAYLDVIDRSLKRARALKAEDPAEAWAIWQSIVTLYGDKPWAAKRVEQAKEELERKSE